MMSNRRFGDNGPVAAVRVQAPVLARDHGPVHLRRRLQTPAQALLTTLTLGVAVTKLLEWATAVVSLFGFFRFCFSLSLSAK